MTRTRFFIALCLILFAALPESLIAQNEYRDRMQRPEAIMDTVGIKPGMVIGEAGAGDGYLTFWLARRVGETGKIYANDINEKSLRKIEDRSKRERISNIRTVVGDVDDPLFPVKDLDLVIMLMAFHDFEQPVQWLNNLTHYLKSGARLVIVDKDPDRWGQGHGHFMTKNRLLETVQKSDFAIERIETFLEQDNIYIFSRKNK
ncbi:MAG: class I SAM-dependent methyltransferase [Candidatus Zhuqueibacterota bacterium]